MEQTLIDVYHFLFETFGGIVILLASAIVLSIIACVIMEIKQRKALKARHEAIKKMQEEDAYDDSDNDWDEE